MAKNEKRVKITLACEECKRRNYITMKSKVNDRERIEMNKYCRWDKRHTVHKETRASRHARQCNAPGHCTGGVTFCGLDLVEWPQYRHGRPVGRSRADRRRRRRATGKLSTSSSGERSWTRSRSRVG